MWFRCSYRNWQQLSRRSMELDGERESLSCWTELHTISQSKLARAFNALEWKSCWVHHICTRQRLQSFGSLISREATSILKISRPARGKYYSSSSSFVVRSKKSLDWYIVKQRRSNQNAASCSIDISSCTCSTTLPSSLFESYVSYWHIELQ